MCQVIAALSQYTQQCTTETEGNTDNFHQCSPLVQKENGDKKYVFGSAALSGLVISTILGWDAPLFTDAAHGTWHWMPWVVLVFILIFPTYLSYWLMPIGLKYLKTTVVAMYGYLILIVTTVVSYIVGQDRFTWEQGVAIGMICLSVYFVEVAERRK